MRVIRETAHALIVRIQIETVGYEPWIPKSKIHDNSEVYAGGTSGRLVIPLWLAEEKGLPT